MIVVVRCLHMETELRIVGRCGMMFSNCPLRHFGAYPGAGLSSGTLWIAYRREMDLRYRQLMSLTRTCTTTIGTE
jgi:hypothetical protein